MDAQEILKNLEKDLKYYNDSIKEVAYEVLSSKISKYPIFIAHQHEVKIGEVILNKDDFEKNWTINATTVEELIENKIISTDKENDFKRIYKDPKQFICIFLITEKGGNFVFHPYKKADSCSVSY